MPTDLQGWLPSGSETTIGGRRYVASVREDLDHRTTIRRLRGWWGPLKAGAVETLRGQRSGATDSLNGNDRRYVSAYIDVNLTNNTPLEDAQEVEESRRT